MKIKRRSRLGQAPLREPAREEQAGATSSGVRDRRSRRGPKREATFSERIREQLSSNPRGGTWRV